MKAREATKATRAIKIKSLFIIEVLLNLLNLEMNDAEIYYILDIPYAPAIFKSVKEGIINLNSLCGRTLKIPMKIKAGPIISKVVESISPKIAYFLF